MKYYLLLFIGILTSYPVNELKTADEILEDYYEAIGGKEEILKVKNVSYFGKVEISMKYAKRKKFSKPSVAEIEIYKNGEKFYSKSGTSEVYFDGFKGYIKQKDEKIPISPMEFENYKKSSQFVPELIYDNIKLIGQREVDGIDCNVLEISNEQTSYYSSTTGLKIMDKLSGNRRGVQAEIVVYYKNYETINGLKIPMKIESITSMPQFILKQTQIISSVEFNQVIDKFDE